MGIRALIGLVALALALSSAEAHMPIGLKGYEGVSVTNEATFAHAIDRSVEVGYVVRGVNLNLKRAFRGSTDALISRDSAASAVSRLRSARVYPYLATDVLYINQVHPEARDYVLEWMGSVSNDYPLIARYVSECVVENAGFDFWTFVSWSFSADSPGLAMQELLRLTNVSGLVFELYVSRMKTVCSRQAKIALRKRGLSFVTRNGVNPLEPYARRLEAAVNAPRMHGMSELCDELGLSRAYAIPEGVFMTDAEIKETCDKVLIDDMKLDRVSVLLRYSMGTDAYNAFVKLYNEGETR